MATEREQEIIRAYEEWNPEEETSDQLAERLRISMSPPGEY